MSFETDVVKKLSEVYPNASITVSDVVKANNTYRGIHIRMPESKIAPTLYVAEFESAYKAGEITFDQAIAKMISLYDEAMASMPQAPEINPQMVAERVGFRMLNKERNQEIMFTSPYMEFNDLIMVPYIEIDMPGTEKASARVTTSLLESLGMTVDDVFKACVNNAKPVVKSMNEIVREIMLKDMPEDTTDEDLDMMLGLMPDNKMYICTNADKHYGAALFMMGSVMEDVSRKFDDNVIVLPSSVHEVILVPASMMDPSHAKEMVRSVNDECVSSSDFLSDNVYLYDREKKEFREFSQAQEI